MNTNIDCRTVSRLLSDALERELDPDDRVRLTHHFGLCDACRNVDRQMTLMHRAMKSIDAEHRDP
jgi:predicted anti-sigma-YlaC factor YlaD